MTAVPAELRLALLQCEDDSNVLDGTPSRVTVEDPPLVNVAEQPRVSNLEFLVELAQKRMAGMDAPIQ